MRNVIEIPGRTEYPRCQFESWKDYITDQIVVEPCDGLPVASYLWESGEYRYCAVHEKLIVNFRYRERNAAEKYFRVNHELPPWFDPEDHRTALPSCAKCGPERPRPGVTLWSTDDGDKWCCPLHDLEMAGPGFLQLKKDTWQISSNSLAMLELLRATPLADIDLAQFVARCFRLVEPQLYEEEKKLVIVERETRVPLGKMEAVVAEEVSAESEIMMDNAREYIFNAAGIPLQARTPLWVAARRAAAYAAIISQREEDEDEELQVIGSNVALLFEQIEKSSEEVLSAQADILRSSIIPRWPEEFLG